MSTHTDCIFCRIARGEIPGAVVVFRDDRGEATTCRFSAPPDGRLIDRVPEGLASWRH